MRIPVPALIALFILSFFVDWYIFRDIRQYLRGRSRKFLSWAYAIVSVLLWILLIVIACLPLRDQDRSTEVVMWLLFGYLSIYFPKALYTICSLIGRLFHRKGKKNLNIGAMIGGPLAVILFIVMWWGVFFTRRDLEVVNVEIESPRLPASFNGYRIVQFSDAHVGTWGQDTTFVSAMVDSINALHPDAIFFTGDIVNRRTSELLPFVKILSRLNAPDGVYSILGNHDYGDYIDWKTPEEKKADHQLLIDLEKKMGWRLLNNESAWIRRENDSIPVIGVENWGDPPFKCYGDLSKAYGKEPGSDLNDGYFKILLTHNPAHWTEHVIKESNIDLTLSGHTHAMQAAIGPIGHRWSPAVFRYKQWGGLYNELAKDSTDMRLYVNIGSGEVGIPTRIGTARPELTLFELKVSEK